MIKPKLLSCIITAALSSFCLVSCQRTNDNMVTVAIQKMEPSGESPLVRGMTVKFEGVVLAHHIPPESTVALVIQAADGTVLGVGGPVSISDNQAIELSSIIRIPATTSVTAFTPLYLGGKSESTTVDSRIYRVVGQ